MPLMLRWHFRTEGTPMLAEMKGSPCGLYQPTRLLHHLPKTPARFLTLQTIKHTVIHNSTMSPGPLKKEIELKSVYDTRNQPGIKSLNKTK